MDGGAVVDAARSMLADPRIRSAGIEGFLVEEMAHGSVEMALGGVVDPVFGPVVMIGLGGIFLEVFDDVSFRIVPASEHDIRAMLEELRSLPILQGTRGRLPVDLDQVVETALAVGGRGGLLDTYREVIVELDINPLLVGDGPPVAADVRIVTVPQPKDKERMPRGSETV
jgi:acetyl-CoA synthetase (ADP-forming)